MSESIAVKAKVGGRKKKVSYSQFQTYLKCPFAWKLSYVDNMRTFEQNVHCAFGTAVHEAIQTFLSELYYKTDGSDAGETKGSIAADSVDVRKIFDDVFEKELKNEKKVSCKDDEGHYILDDEGKKTYETISEPVEIDDTEKETFRKHGYQILDAATGLDSRRKYFPPKKYQLFGIESVIDMPIMNNLKFIGYLDIVLYDPATKKYKIIDLKTSTRMWNKYQQNDIFKIYQLLLYKAFFSQQFGVPLTKIDVEFIILKRTLMENVSFPESRLQRVNPPATKNFVNESVSDLVRFIRHGFTEDGKYNVEGKFQKNPHKGKTRYSNCKYCEFSVKNGGPCDRKEGTCD